MQLSSEQHLVVAGFGMAAHALCRELARIPKEQRPRVTVIGQEPEPAYNRVRLSEAMMGARIEELLLAPNEFYAQQGIETLLGDTVVHIDREQCRVHTQAGRQIGYDALVLATGSDARRPNLPGIDDPACFVYRSLADLERLARALDTAKGAAVIGGGLLGLEAAGIVQKRGVSVTVLESGSGLMPRQLDAASGRCLQAHVEALGVEVRVSEQARAIERDGARLHVRLDKSASLMVDLVIVAAGITPRDQLAAAAGLACNLRGGVVVDDALCTSDPKIFAIGECASHRGVTYGILPPCQQMAEVLGKRLRGLDATFSRPDLSCRLKLLGVEVAALGDYGNEHRAVSASLGQSHRTLLLEGSKLVGAMVVGDYRELPRLQQAIAERESLSERQLARFERGAPLFRDGATLPVTAWPDDAMLCNCAQVRVGEVRKELSRGVCDAVAVAKRTRATTGCGSCRPLLGTLLGDAKLAAQRARTFGLTGWSVAACLLVVVSLLASPIDFATSVSDGFRAVDALWRERGMKQTTGFTVLGLALFGLVLSLRKRVSWPKRGAFNLYRALHAGLGALTLLVLVAHTGFRLGENLNLALMLSFLLASLFGAAVGVASGIESRGLGAPAVRARRLRPYAALLHIVFLWPLPVLIGLHVLAVYYF